MSMGESVVGMEQIVKLAARKDAPTKPPPEGEVCWGHGANETTKICSHKEALWGNSQKSADMKDALT